MRSGTAKGACLCGAVRLEVDLPSKWCAHCHCSMCRRAHGAAYVTWFGVDADAFRLVAGAGRLERFASSADAVRGFCRGCGSTLTFESSRWPGEVHVALGSMLDPIDRAPTAHVFWDDRAAWTHVADRLPRRGGPTGTGTTADDDRVRAAVAADPRVRLATPDDAGVVATLFERLAAVEWEETPADLRANVSRFLSEAHESFVLVAEHRGSVAGFAAVHVFPAIAEGAVALVLDDLWVDEAARGSGLGTALVAATLAVAKELRAAIVWLSARPDNAPARRLYQGHGFRPSTDVLFEWAPKS